MKISKTFMLAGSCLWLNYSCADIWT